MHASARFLLHTHVACWAVGPLDEDEECSNKYGCEKGVKLEKIMCNQRLKHHQRPLHHIGETTLEALHPNSTQRDKLWILCDAIYSYASGGVLTRLGISKFRKCIPNSIFCIVSFRM